MHINLNDFDTIIFDFGGVILDIDPQKTIDAFTELTSPEAVKTIQESGILDEMERGELTPDELYKKTCQHINQEIPKDKFFEAWNAILLDYKQERLDYIAKLKKTHQLLLLSNTNEVHFKTFSEKMEKEHHTSFSNLFETLYLSYEMGLLKPDAEIYKRILQDKNLNPEKTLFIEDTKVNADKAEELGIKTLVIKRNGTFYDHFKK